MARRVRQLRLDLGDQHLWDQFQVEAKQQCLTLLKQLIQDVWKQHTTLEEGSDHD